MLGMLPALGGTAKAEVLSGTVSFSALKVDDIIGLDVTLISGSGTIVLQCGGYCDADGHAGFFDVDRTMTSWQFDKDSDLIRFCDNNEGEYLYPYANGRKVESWRVVSVVSGTVTLTGYVETQSNNPFTQAVSYRRYNSSGVLQENGTLAANAGILVESDTMKWTGGNTYVVSGNVTIDKRVVVTGTVNLILLDGATLTAARGVALNYSSNDGNRDH